MDEDNVLEAFETLDERLKELSYQLDCTRRIQAIEMDLHSLRVNAENATFAVEQAERYALQSGTAPSWTPTSEKDAHEFVLGVVDLLKEYFEDLHPFEYTSPILLSLLLCLRDLQREIREATRESFRHSLNEIAESCRCIWESFDEMRNSIKKEFQKLKVSGRAGTEECSEVREPQKLKGRWISETPRWLWEMRCRSDARAAQGDRTNSSRIDDQD